MATLIHVVPHTHWDREWYDAFETYRFRLVKMVDALLDLLETDPDFRHFNFDGQTAAIEDYLEIRPEARERLTRLVSVGRLAVGPWRILMDEFLCSPETIVRNIRQGSQLAASLGRVQRIGYIPDSFGHIAQMPQLLRLAGIDDAVVWRGVPAAVDKAVFRWEAPDGSAVRAAYLATSYSNAATLPPAVDDLLARGERIIADIRVFADDGIVLAMNGSDHRPAQAHLPGSIAAANARQTAVSFRIGSLQEYFAALPDPHVTWRGEMRSSARANLLPGVASARMPLKQLALRASTALERFAEPLAWIAGADPGRNLERAWRWMVENSAHDSICGCGIDAVADQVAARYRDAERIADLVASDALASIAGDVDSRWMRESGVLVFNPSQSDRNDVVEITLPLPRRPARLSFRQPDGSVVPAQIISVEPRTIVDMTLTGQQLARIVPTIHSRMIGEHHVNGLSIRGDRVVMRLGARARGRFDVERAKRSVEDAIERSPDTTYRVVGHSDPLVTAAVRTAVPALGWTTLEPVTEASAAPPAETVVSEERTISNGIVALDVEPDGRATVIDLGTGARFEGLFGIEDSGDGGDEYNYSPPPADTIVRTPARAPVIRTLHHGPLLASIAVGMAFRVPAALTKDRRARRQVVMPVSIVYSLRAGEPFVRATIRIENKAQNHRVRVVFPLPAPAGHSEADGAFAPVVRPLRGEGGPHEHATGTYPAGRWVRAWMGDRAATVLLDGTPEYELTADALSITLLRCVGWLSRQGFATRSGPAGPSIATPGAQLEGIHTASFGFMPSAADPYAAAERFGLAAKATTIEPHDGPRPAIASNARIEPATVRLSALEPNGVIRVFNAGPEPVEAVVHAHAKGATVVDLLGEAIDFVEADEGAIRLRMRGHEIVSLRLER